MIKLSVIILDTKRLLYLILSEETTKREAIIKYFKILKFNKHKDTNLDINTLIKQENKNLKIVKVRNKDIPKKIKGYSHIGAADTLKRLL